MAPLALGSSEVYKMRMLGFAGSGLHGLGMEHHEQNPRYFGSQSTNVQSASAVASTDPARLESSVVAS